MHDLPGQLSVETLAALFGGGTRFVARLAAYEDPLGRARDVLRTLPEDEVIEAINAHPRIGARQLPSLSAAEQGADDDPAVLAELECLNARYEAKFGFRFLVFVGRRPRGAIVEVLRARLGRTREEELQTAIDDLVAIAVDRYRRGVR
ncbi:MAG: 2-oxo-4-hydroxy-4-carboxy-5-ureidoimidazoline decarboxylase [Armatimonadota bacterium]|nr:2-oxo-4-hydroxy-4-carboxy-5-ureidoimidazoline decarboxylase [Armatimonadota bacterium]MDR7485938.1 2-oxo-4-hydroxy-4-carboxy-5-ureidoimidazoline decarboxylase [Armatimonadota bacterium]MDR7533828.1 2-oxo-4-hydroxy-4-carboxy-5-ureidoimidazoline decarboxylase [Armatimonadota bacterium]MDR7536643.1 2-oxo-4-hydroxy-4-carboxy-5-ureidoimidazoline decarboxylase [Armatimonadota bacterium]